jgi:hypothetical protein
MDSVNGHGSFEVLSPWAEADPIPLFGISPRLENLEGKTIGLFVNFKRAAGLILKSVERELQQRYPSVKTSWYKATGANIPEVETVNGDKFKQWVSGLDALVLSVGD